MRNRRTMYITEELSQVTEFLTFGHEELSREHQTIRSSDVYDLSIRHFTTRIRSYFQHNFFDIIFHIGYLKNVRNKQPCLVFDSCKNNSSLWWRWCWKLEYLLCWPFGMINIFLQKSAFFCHFLLPQTKKNNFYLIVS